MPPDRPHRLRRDARPTHCPPRRESVGHRRRGQRTLHPARHRGEGAHRRRPSPQRDRRTHRHHRQGHDRRHRGRGNPPPHRHRAEHRPRRHPRSAHRRPSSHRSQRGDHARHRSRPHRRARPRSRRVPHHDRAPQPGRARRDIAQARQQADRAQLDATAEELGGLRRDLDHRQNTQPAAALHALATEHTAQAAESGQRYIVLQLQREILSRELLAYERQHSSQLLTTAGELLERLTGGRYAAVRPRTENHQRSLVVVRADRRRTSARRTVRSHRRPALPRAAARRNRPTPVRAHQPGTPHRSRRPGRHPRHLRRIPGGRRGRRACRTVRSVADQ